MSEPAAPRRSQWVLPAAVVAGLVLAGVAMALILRSGGDAAPEARATPTATPEPRGTIAFERGRATQLGDTREALLQRLGPPALPARGFPERPGKGLECVYYIIRQQPTRYQFCFDRRDEVVSIATVFAQQ